LCSCLYIAVINVQLVYKLKKTYFSVTNMNLNRNIYTVNRIIPPITKEAFHYETEKSRVFRTICPNFVP
jgi:hypothetical protein